MLVHELRNELLNILGLCIDKGRIFDIDTGQYLLLDGKLIYDQDSALLIHKNDIRFNPLGNTQLTSYLLNVALQKDAQENGTYAKVISINEFPNRNPAHGFAKRSVSLQLEFHTNMKPYNQMMHTGYYYNLCLAYIEMIYKVSCVPLSFNLYEMDYTEENMIEQAKRIKR